MCTIIIRSAWRNTHLKEIHDGRILLDALFWRRLELSETEWDGGTETRVDVMEARVAVNDSSAGWPNRLCC